MTRDLQLTTRLNPATTFEKEIIDVSNQALGLIADDNPYHCIEHALIVADAFNLVASQAEKRNIISRRERFIGFYASLTHDAVFNENYKSTKGKNEHESTKLALHLLSYYPDFTYEDQEIIGRMHDSTVVKEVGCDGIVSSPGTSYLEKLIVDADLHAIGSEWPIAKEWMERFRNEEIQNRPEHPFNDDIAFYNFEEIIHRGQKYQTLEGIISFWRGPINAARINEMSRVAATKKVN